MIKRYTNEKIYKNFKVAKILTGIALVLFTLLFVNDVICIVLDIKKFNYILVIQYLIMLGPILSVYIMSGKMWFGYGYQSRLNNDILNLKSVVIISFLPWYFVLYNLVVDLIWEIFFDRGLYLSFVFAEIMGSCLPLHIFVYIADIFLVKNCKLIKAEWEENPPLFLREGKKFQAMVEEEKARKEIECKEKQDLKKCEACIEKCGVRFFIKYYRQILNLPLRDVEVSENYTSEEKEERLNAAKKLVNLNLSKMALTEIIKKYSDSLKAEEVEQAKALLKEMEATNEM